MKRIKIIWVLIGFISCVTALNGQSVLTIEASQLYASFKFYDSQETKLNSEYSGIFTGAWGLGYRYILDNGVMFRTGLGMRKAGATLVYDDMNYRWDLQYAELRQGFGYVLIKDRVSPYLDVSGYFAYMLRGFQTINNEDFDIKDSESLKGMDFGIYITPGIKITFSEAVSSFVEFNYIMGLQNIEKDEGQKSSNYAFGLTLGLSFSFVNNVK